MGSWRMIRSSREMERRNRSGWKHQERNTGLQPEPERRLERKRGQERRPDQRPGRRRKKERPERQRLRMQ